MTVCNHLRGQRGERILCYSIKAALLGQHFVHIVVQCLVRFPNPLADFFSSQAGTLSVQCLPLSPASFSPSTRTSRSKWRRTRLWLAGQRGRSTDLSAALSLSHLLFLFLLLNEHSEKCESFCCSIKAALF